MKRAKRLKILAGALVVAAVATFGVLHVQEKQEEIANTDAVILDIDPASVTALSWSYDENAFSFHKDGDWTYDDDADFPVDPEQIEVLLSYFDEMGAAFVIEDAEDLGQYGLDDPSCTIDITTDDGETTVLLGDYSSMDSQRYVSIGDGNVYLVASDPLPAYEIELSDLIDNDDIPGFGTVDSIRFEGDSSYDVVHQDYDEAAGLSTNSADVYYKQDGDDLAPLDTDKVSQYLEALSGLSQDTVVTYKASEEDIATYGLDDPELEATIGYTVTEENEDGEKTETAETFSFALSRDAATKAADAEAEADEDASDEEESEEDKLKAYVRIGDSPIIYEIGETSYEALMAYSYNDLRHDALYNGAFADITQFDVTISGTSASITSEEADDDGRTFSYDGETVDTSAIQTALEAVTAASFTDAAADGEEELALTLHLDNEAIPTVELAFYRHDGETCLVTVDGEPTAYVARSAVVDLIEAFNTIIL